MRVPFESSNGEQTLSLFAISPLPGVDKPAVDKMAKSKHIPHCHVQFNLLSKCTLLHLSAQSVLVGVHCRQLWPGGYEKPVPEGPCHVYCTARASARHNMGGPRYAVAFRVSSGRSGGSTQCTGATVHTAQQHAARPFRERRFTNRMPTSTDGVAASRTFSSPQPHNRSSQPRLPSKCLLASAQNTKKAA
ncbi:hypothetical protein EYF80_005419 [Liparis tanakae]|uniref:Uncharacterized protein n=1 Tax=Liparis tanakae TaxID=230148 RepID=A0A4Z2J2M1_9TELE|nr:hypothetical protein EYF80_005419 [Liparis tanakae]